MASQYDQNGTRQDNQHDQRGRAPQSSSEAQFTQSQSPDYDDRFAGQGDYPRHFERGGDYGRNQGREQGRWARDRQGYDQSGYGREGYEGQLSRDPSFPPAIRYSGERGRDQNGPWATERGYGDDHQGVFAYQRHGAAGQGYGRSDGGLGRTGYGAGGGQAQGSYGQGGYAQGGYEQRGFGEGGFGMGGSGPRRSEQEHAMQGLVHYDQDYSSPSRGAYGQGGYGGRNPGRENYGWRGQQSTYGGQGLQDSGRRGYGRGSFELDDDGPIESGYLGDSDRGNWARGYEGEGSSGTSMGYSTRRHGGSGYAEQTGSRGQYGGGGNPQGRSYRGMGPRGYMRSDERLCEDINERLTDDDHIDASEISVDVKDGVVTLSGEVEQRRLKHRIEDMVERCHGVQDIRNEIRVKRGNEGAGSRSGGSSAGSSTRSGSTAASATGVTGQGSGASGQRSSDDASSGTGSDQNSSLTGARKK